VRFLQAVAAITMSKTRTRLNLKKLYAADGAAVRELLKLAELLHKAMHTVSSYQEVSIPGLQLQP
jgi:clusterin-associated protein 1